MSENERKKLEYEIEQKVEERLNVKELKKIRYQLEEMNREHEKINYQLIRVTSLQSQDSNRITKIEEKTFWTIFVDWLAIMVKKKETIIIPLLMGLAAFGQQIFQLIKSLL